MLLPKFFTAVVFCGLLAVSALAQPAPDAPPALQAPGPADRDAGKDVQKSDDGAPPGAVPPAPAPGENTAAGEKPQTPGPTGPPRTGAESLCRTLGEAAADNDLPLTFFFRLIWQESRFKPGVVSRAGAQGMAQFMPRTAAWRGLADPFDPLQALPQSAAYLRELRAEFGNLGLAAAAYNGGPGRVRNWLAKRGELPRETRAYVAIITGHTVDDWAAGDRNLDALAFPPGIACTELAALIRAPRVPRTRGPAPAKPVPLWGVQLAANWSEGKALEAFTRMRQQFQSILAGREPVVLRSRAGRGATMHRVRVAADTRQGAEQLCARLRAAGGACAVLRN